VVADLVLDLEVRDDLDVLKFCFPGCVGDGVLLFVARRSSAAFLV
jgi:hypothetical protein